MEEKSSGRETDAMSRIYLLVEGQTEETFVRELLKPYYDSLGIYLNPIIVRTSPDHAGGVLGYGKVRFQLSQLQGASS